MSAATRPLAAIALAIALLGGACGDDAVVTTPVTGQTGGGPATTGADGTSTTGPATTPSDGTSPDGAGCTPEGDTLGDGRWFGYVRSADPTALSFDLACWFSGEAAVVAAAADGGEPLPPDGHHVRNNSDRLRDLAVDPAAVTVSWYRQAGDPTTEVETPYAEWRAARTEATTSGVWVEIDGGQVRRIEEERVP
jgi:hypothetical protein